MTTRKRVLISKEELQKALKVKGFFGNLLASWSMSVLSLNRINKMYSATYDENVDIFIDNALKHNNNKLVTLDKDLSTIPEKGPVIFLCNHPFGGWDGMAIIKTLLKVRPDTKFLVNFLLARIEPIKPHLIKVNPFELNKGAFSNISGIKEMYSILEQGNSLCILPAGEVSTKYGKSKIVEDREWQANIIKFVKKANVPVVSCYIDGQNSNFFHFLGKIHPMLRTLRLPKELLKKKDTDINIRISSPMHPKVIQNVNDVETLARILKAKTYCLENKSLIFDEVNTSIDKYDKIIDATPVDLLKDEIEKLKDSNLLFKVDNYLCFFAKHENIPYIFREISRLREITFREIGEATGKDSDCDDYDLYYNHLFIWDENNSAIVGAYRIGMGNDIIKEKGIKGFYINTLFDFDNKFYPYMEKAMEMGRSFIVSEYQRRTLPLFLLWRGIYYVTQKFPEYKYLIGPASISSLYEKHAKILIIEYLKRNYTWTELAELVDCRIPFTYEVNHNHDVLLNNFGYELNVIDKLIKDIDVNRYGIPVLIKKYLSLGGKVLGFNVDPNFNYAIDGLIILDIDVLSDDVINSYSK